MSDQNATTPPGWYPDRDGGQRYWDGTAWTNHTQPAAASRPEAKSNSKKNLIVFGVIALLVLCCGGGGLLAIFSGGEESGPQIVEPNGSSGEKDEHEAPDEDDSPGSASNPAKIGDTIELEGTRYTVKKAETAGSVGSEFFKEDADGMYVIVTLTIENIKDETKTFFSGAAVLVSGKSKRYETDTDAVIAAAGDGDDPLIFEDMQPDVPKTGQLVYDVPKDAAVGSLLEVSDLFGRGEAFIDLGLR